jgi:hypothetical protein
MILGWPPSKIVSGDPDFQPYVKLSSAVAAILVGDWKCRKQMWKGTYQGSFQQSLVEIGSVVSEEKINLKISSFVRRFGLSTKMAPTAELGLT